MNESLRVRRNSFFYFLSIAMRFLTNMVVFVGIARFYGVGEFGQFTTAHTLSAIFLLGADFGFDALLPTEIAGNPDRRKTLARSYFSIKLIFIVVAAVSMLAFSAVGAFSPSTRLLIQVFSLYLVTVSINNFFFALFKGYEEFHHETRITFLTNLLVIIVVFTLGSMHAPLLFIAVGFVGCRILAVILNMRTASRIVGSTMFSMDLGEWNHLKRRVFVFGLHFIFGNLFFLVDTILLALWRGDREVGIYQSVFKIATLVLIVPDIAVNTMMPVLARLNATNEAKWHSQGRLLYKVLYLLSLPAAVVLFVYADQILTVVYGGGAFSEAAPLLRVFAAIILVRFGADAYALMLTTSGRQSVRMKIVMAGTVVNICLNAFMIPRFGAWGAAEVSLVTNCVVALSYVIFSRMPVVQWSFEGRSVAMSVIAALAGVVLWGLREVPILYVLPPFLLGFAAVLFFAGLTANERTIILAGRAKAEV
jgi:O-antigen/teichoic acid export membrane protein